MPEFEITAWFIVEAESEKDAEAKLKSSFDNIVDWDIEDTAPYENPLPDDSPLRGNNGTIVEST